MNEEQLHDLAMSIAIIVSKNLSVHLHKVANSTGAAYAAYNTIEPAIFNSVGEISQLLSGRIQQFEESERLDLINEGKEQVRWHLRKALGQYED